jgi:hypothetical protein
VHALRRLSRQFRDRTYCQYPNSFPKNTKVYDA